MFNYELMYKAYCISAGGLGSPAFNLATLMTVKDLLFDEFSGLFPDFFDELPILELDLVGLDLWFGAGSAEPDPADDEALQRRDLRAPAPALTMMFAAAPSAAECGDLFSDIE